MALTGGCLCGAVRYEADAAPLWLGHCHCGQCRKHTGAALGTYVSFPTRTVRWLGLTPTRYRSSKDVERSFCPTCGSTIGFHRSNETSLTIGSFDRPEEVVADGLPCIHVWRAERIGWFETADRWPRHDRFAPGREAELERLRGRPIEG